MTTIQISLPEALAQEAQRAGLLDSATLERLLREQLQARKIDDLFSAMDRMAAVDAPSAMSPEEVAEAMSAWRAH